MTVGALVGYELQTPTASGHTHVVGVIIEEGSNLLVVAPHAVAPSSSVISVPTPATLVTRTVLLLLFPRLLGRLPRHALHERRCTSQRT